MLGVNEPKFSQYPANGLSVGLRLLFLQMKLKLSLADRLDVVLKFLAVEMLG